jgi:Chaperone of endosialidase
MNMKPLILIPMLIIGLGVLPKAQAVSPGPDGGYAGFNTAEGQNALLSLTTGTANTAVGWFSLFSNADGSFNTATGAGALLFNTADQNTAFGTAALLFNTTGGGNTATGAAALLNNTTGLNNTAVGTNALQANIGSFNNAVGSSALNSNTTGLQNSAIGTSALGANTTGSANTAAGGVALFNSATGDDNTALGFRAGFNQTNGSGNVYIGRGMEGVSGENNSCYIRSIFGQTSANGMPVFINSANKLGTTVSSKRFKEDIKPMDKTSEALLALKPVTFRYKKEIDPAGKSQFGLVAEEVEKVNPDLVVRDKEGKPYSVRYDQVNAMLLNEFLKEHRKVEEQASRVREHEATITQLKSADAKQEVVIVQQQKEIETLIGTLQKQASQIQKVSARLAAGQSEARLVANDQSETSKERKRP